MAKTILIVEDQRVISLYLEQALRDAGFDVHSEPGELAAINVASKLSLVAAVIDLALPDLSGADVARALRAKHPSLAIVVTTTGFRCFKVTELATELQLQVVYKPYIASQVVAMLQESTAARAPV